MALALVGLGLARRATTGLALGLTLVGVIIPIVGLALLTPEVSAGLPLEISLAGGSTTWLALYGRADSLSVFAAIGVAVIIAPILVWLAWQSAPLDATEEAELASSEDTEASAEASETTTGTRPELGRWQWTGVALALAIESLALWLCFSENIVLLGIVWIALVVGAWALGELGSETAILDWRGLSLMVVGPLVWLVTTLLIAVPAGARRMLDLTGDARIPNGHVFVLSLALIFAAGGYPALAWLRKRASIATPAGLAAISLALMPAALFVGARTFSIGATTSSSWVALSIGKPPVTVGILLTLFGAASVVMAGLMALGRRDPRALLAMLTLAQAGWGLIGLGVGAPLSLLGVTLLLATAVIGLGAVITALVSAGAITSDIEPESAGPRILGEPARPVLLFAWLVSVASLIGAPLFAGFAPLQIISAQALTGPRLAIPLIGVAWVGSALLAIALVRATAPAYTAPLVVVYTSEDESAEAAESSDGADDDAASGESGETEVVTPQDLRIEELPALALGVLALLIGIAPGIALTIARPAAEATMQSGALDGLFAASSSGYVAGVGQWFATPPIIFVAVGALILAYLRTRMPREIRPLLAAADTDASHLDAETDEAEMAELNALPEPADAWSDLRPAFHSGWATPGAGWLGLDGDDTEGDDSDDTFTDDETPEAKPGAAAAARASEGSEE